MNKEKEASVEVSKKSDPQEKGGKPETRNPSYSTGILEGCVQRSGKFCLVFNCRARGRGFAKDQLVTCDRNEPRVWLKKCLKYFEIYKVPRD